MNQFKATLFLLSVISQSATAKISIPWLTIDLFPCHNASENQYGYCDEVSALIHNDMVDYQFNRERVNLPRITSSMKRGTLFCTIDLLKNRVREQHMAFSKPVFYLMPPVLVSRKDTHFSRLLIERPHVSLDDIMSSNLRLGVRAERHYTDSINGFIERYQSQAPVYRSNSDATLNDMVKGNRLDVTFMNAAELPVFDTEAHLVGQFIHAEQYTPVYIACTNTLLGRRIIKDFDAVIDSHPASTLAVAYEKFLPESLKMTYRQWVESLR
jgi:uncharacterized protein (TIGR02285 family)